MPATGGSITVVGKGYGYTTAPTITVNAGSCTPAVPVAVVSNYEVTSVTGTCVAGTDLTIAEPT